MKTILNKKPGERKEKQTERRKTLDKLCSKSTLLVSAFCSELHSSWFTLNSENWNITEWYYSKLQAVIRWRQKCFENYSRGAMDTGTLTRKERRAFQKVIGRSYEVRFKWRQLLPMFVILDHFARQHSIFFRNWVSQTWNSPGLFCLKQRLATIEHNFRFLLPQVRRKFLWNYAYIFAWLFSFFSFNMNPYSPSCS